MGKDMSITVAVNETMSSILASSPLRDYPIALTIKFGPLRLSIIFQTETTEKTPLTSTALIAQTRCERLQLERLDVRLIMKKDMQTNAVDMEKITLKTAPAGDPEMINHLIDISSFPNWKVQIPAIVKATWAGGASTIDSSYDEEYDLE
ncbi:unnamed protein product [Soboliphyme baturini]|uniref:VPS13_mid_rpt domain-containing protein n=1 Tax=Soboliphyme baturini TaxID=241478 RepID=A0A183IF34_9BILA|nr:unnamed protein product [Soboliphyme baturini]